MNFETPMLRRLLKGRHVRKQSRTRLQDLVTAGDKANAGRDWAAAAGLYEAALALNPALTPIWVQYGHALKEQGFLNKALDAYRQSLALDDTCADTYLQIGHVLKLQGRTDMAQSAYRNSFLCDPASPQSRIELEDMGVALHHPGMVDTRQTIVLQPAGSETGQPAAKWQGNSNSVHEDPGFISDVYGPGTHQSDAKYVNIGQLLETHGLGDAFLNSFDSAFYYYANVGARERLGSVLPSQAKCLVHFCEVGIDDIFTIAEHLSFDPDFYRMTYLEQFACTASNAYRHWLTLGVAKGWAPNRACWVKNFIGRDLTGLDEINISLGSRDKVLRTT